MPARVDKIQANIILPVRNKSIRIQIRAAQLLLNFENCDHLAYYFGHRHCKTRIPPMPAQPTPLAPPWGMGPKCHLAPWPILMMAGEGISAWDVGDSQTLDFKMISWGSNQNSSNWEGLDWGTSAVPILIFLRHLLPVAKVSF